MRKSGKGKINLLKLLLGRSGKVRLYILPKKTIRREWGPGQQKESCKLEAGYRGLLATSAASPGSIRNKEADGDVEQSVLFYVRENQVQYLFFSSVLYMEVLTNTNAGRNEMHAYIFFFNIQ